MAKYTHDTYAVKIYDEDGTFVGYNNSKNLSLFIYI